MWGFMTLTRQTGPRLSEFPVSPFCEERPCKTLRYLIRPDLLAHPKGGGCGGRSGKGTQTSMITSIGSLFSSVGV
jgi:hypothetical protein